MLEIDRSYIRSSPLSGMVRAIETTMQIKTQIQSHLMSGFCVSECSRELLKGNIFRSGDKSRDKLKL